MKGAFKQGREIGSELLAEGEITVHLRYQQAYAIAVSHAIDQDAQHLIAAGILQSVQLAKSATGTRGRQHPSPGVTSGTSTLVLLYKFVVLSILCLLQTLSRAYHADRS